MPAAVIQTSFTAPGNMDKLDEKTYSKLAELVYNKIGIVLGPQKHALVSARVGKRMRAVGLQRYRDYLDLVSNHDPEEKELIELLNAISTNVTHFYRENSHFTFLETILKEWETKGQKRFRIWCAASSTGEEPYTIAMTAREALTDPSDCKILGTDISTRVLDIARCGEYEAEKVEKLPPQLKQTYTSRNTSGKVTMKPCIKNMLKFGRINLATPPYPLKGPLDIVFCRNVMIYFDNTVRNRLLKNVYNLLKPGGYLFVGHAESLSGMLSAFQPVQPSIYIKSKASGKQ